MSTPKAKGRNLAQQVVQNLITEDEWKRAAQSLWDIATQGSKPDWVYCPHCDRKIQADRVDLRARADALQKLSELGFGKPQTDEDKQSLIVKRTIVKPREVTGGVHD
jgi:hypothetical protein